MNIVRAFRSTGAVAIFFAAALSGFGQVFIIQKSASFIQTGSSAPTPDPLRPYQLDAIWPGTSFTNLTLTTPTGRSVAIPRRTSDEYELVQAFASKAALDAAFPNGTYTVSATGQPTRTLNFGSDLYPTGVPQVLNGTWNSGGMLVVDPTRENTVTVNTFPGYGSVGVGSYLGLTAEGDNEDADRSVVSSQALSVVGLPVSATAPTSLVIPARTFTAGRVYVLTLTFLHAHSIATPAGAPNGLIASNDHSTKIFVAALAPGANPVAAPVIARQPTDLTARPGTSATFTVGTTFNGSNTFPATGTFLADWYFNGATINPSAKYAPNGAQLVINTLTAADAGEYSYRIVTTGGMASSNVVKLTVTSAPAIVAQPTSRTVVSGTTVVFSAAAAGAPEPTYQWRKDGNLVPGATSATLVIPAATAAQAGSYTLVATNTINNVATPVTSNAATLTISSTTDFGRISNLSILTNLATGEGLFTVGTVIGGAGTVGNKSLLVRAVGPTLGAAPFSIPGTLPDPKLELYSNGAVVAANDNWAGTAALSGAFTAVGAFPYVNAFTKDAAYYNPTLAAGSYTVQVSDAAAGTGTVIAELYDSTSGGSFTAATPRLINVSVLKQIPANELLTAGFVIGGSTAKTVLIRAVGPTLAAAPFNIGNAMADPQLALFNGASVQIGANDNWGGDAQLAAVGTGVGAFALSSATSKDAVLLVTLAPGNYTAQARGITGTGGMAIVEVYEVP